MTKKIKQIDEILKAHQRAKDNFDFNVWLNTYKDDFVTALTVLQKMASGDDWFPIESAPRDGTRFLGRCKHSADEYHIGEGRVTIYGMFCEIGDHVEDGVHILEYGGGFDDSSYEAPDGANMPDYWFLSQEELVIVANPTHWKHIDQAKHVEMLIERELNK